MAPQIPAGARPNHRAGLTMVPLGDLAAIRLRPGDALFLDFDGTLTDIGPDPDAIRLTPETAEALGLLAARLEGALAILSGRDIRDLAARVPLDLWRAGGHGLEIIAPAAPSPPAPPGLPEPVLSPLRAVATAGARLELKGPIAALHYRAAPERAAACHAAAREAAARASDLIVQVGKMVVEVKPAVAHKGTALMRMMEMPAFTGRRPIMLGDDTTDEDAITVAQSVGGLGIHIGGGFSTAHLRAPSPAAVRAWLVRESA